MMPEEDVKLPPTIPKYISLILIILGIIFYISWVGTEPSAWNDIGVYSVTVILLGFGIAGYLLFGYKEKHQNDEE